MANNFETWDLLELFFKIFEPLPSFLRVFMPYLLALSQLAYTFIVDKQTQKYLSLSSAVDFCVTVWLFVALSSAEAEFERGGEGMA